MKIFAMCVIGIVLMFGIMSCEMDEDCPRAGGPDGACGVYSAGRGGTSADGCSNDECAVVKNPSKIGTKCDC
jgi:hypothetical protein